MSGTGQKVYCGGWVDESNFSVIFGPNLKTKTLLRPRPKLNTNVAKHFFVDSRKEGSKKCCNKNAEKFGSAHDPVAFQQNSQTPKTGCQNTDNTNANLHETYPGVNENLASVVEAYFQKTKIHAEDQKIWMKIKHH